MDMRTPQDGAPRRSAYIVPGSQLQEVKKGSHACGGCKSPVLVAMVKDSHTGTLRWKNFDPKPIESGAVRLYRRHICPR